MGKVSRRQFIYSGAALISSIAPFNIAGAFLNKKAEDSSEKKADETSTSNEHALSPKLNMDSKKEEPATEAEQPAEEVKEEE